MRAVPQRGPARTARARRTFEKPFGSKTARTALGDRLGEDVSVTTSFATPGLKTVELEPNELCVGSSRLTCSSFAFVSTATDSHGNVGHETFAVVVSDTTAPALAGPGTLTAEATSASGATVDFAVSATDSTSGSRGRT